MALAGSFPVVHQPAPEAYNAWNSRWLELNSGIATLEELKKFLNPKKMRRLPQINEERS
jgi:hypothetical protein